MSTLPTPVSILSFFLLSLLFSCNGTGNMASLPFENDPEKLGGPCEGCEAIYEYGEKELRMYDTLPKFEETEPKLLLTGTVYQQDGKTPAEDVILYIYHTNRSGIYETCGDETGWAKRHGYIRGWIKTDATGQFLFYTFRPAAYPARDEPEHIHITVLEPGKRPYYLDDFLFEDDELLSEKERNSAENRGGNGILQPIEEDGILMVRRDIVLGLNIPHYN